VKATLSNIEQEKIVSSIKTFLFFAACLFGRKEEKSHHLFENMNIQARLDISSLPFTKAIRGLPGIAFQESLDSEGLDILCCIVALLSSISSVQDIHNLTLFPVRNKYTLRSALTYFINPN